MGIWISHITIIPIEIPVVQSMWTRVFVLSIPSPSPPGHVKDTDTSQWGAFAKNYNFNCEPLRPHLPRGVQEK